MGLACESTRGDRWAAGGRAAGALGPASILAKALISKMISSSMSFTQKDCPRRNPNLFSGRTCAACLISFTASGPLQRAAQVRPLNIMIFLLRASCMFKNHKTFYYSRRVRVATSAARSHADATPAHDRSCLGPQRPSQSRVQAGLVSFRPNSRLSRGATFASSRTLAFARQGGSHDTRILSSPPNWFPFRRH